MNTRSVYRPAETAEANWLIIGLAQVNHYESTNTLAGILPSGFEMYARIFHPAFRRVPDKTEIQFYGMRGYFLPVTWGEVAAHQGTKLTGQAQWHQVCGGHAGEEIPKDQIWTDAPMEGVMEPRETALEAFNVLSGQTSPDETCFCAFWEGYGEGNTYPTASHFRTYHQGYFLCEVQFSDLVEYYRHRPLGLNSDTPDMLWPMDHKWFLTSPFQRQASYIGGSEDLIALFCENAKLEAFPIERTDDFWKDTVNVR